MNTKYLVVMAAVAAMLVAATTITTDNALATKYKSKSQAVSQANDCGNGFWAENVWCQNTASQIQGKYNDPALASEQGHGGGNGGNGGDYGGGNC